MYTRKESLREVMLKARDSLTKEEIKTKSNSIFKNLLSLSEIKQARTICSYVSKGSEVDTIVLIESLLKQGKKTVVPVVKTDILKLSLIKNLGELEKGTFGVLEPKKKFLRTVDPSEVDSILVPGIAFDRRGRRIGYGKGYYDKLLQKLKKKTKIALAYEFQVIKEVTSEHHDISVNFIVTEKNIINCGY